MNIGTIGPLISRAHLKAAATTPRETVQDLAFASPAAPMLKGVFPFGTRESRTTAVNRKFLLPAGFAVVAGLSGTIAKKLALVMLIGVGVPITGYHFVQAVVASRAQAISQIQEHRNASQASRMVGPDNPHDVIEDLRASLVIASQMKQRHDTEGSRQIAREAMRVLQRAEVQSGQFKDRLTSDRTVSDAEIRDMERMDELSANLREMRRKLLQGGD